MISALHCICSFSGHRPSTFSSVVLFVSVSGVVSVLLALLFRVILIQFCGFLWGVFFDVTKYCHCFLFSVFPTNFRKFSGSLLEFLWAFVSRFYSMIDHSRKVSFLLLELFERRWSPDHPWRVFCLSIKLYAPRGFLLLFRFLLLSYQKQWYIIFEHGMIDYKSFTLLSSSEAFLMILIFSLIVI